MFLLEGKTKMVESFQAEASVSGAGYGFSGAASARFGTDSEKDEDTKYSIRTIGSNLYRLKLDPSLFGPFSPEECAKKLNGDFCSMLAYLGQSDPEKLPESVVPFVKR